MRIPRHVFAPAASALVVAALFLGCAGWADGPRYATQDLAVAKGPTGLEDTYVVPFDSESHDVSAKMADGQVITVRTELVLTTYRGTMTDVNNPRASPITHSWFLYQLRPTDKRQKYNWYFWSGLLLGHFKLFTLSNGCTYLSWVQGPTLAFAGVSTPMNMGLASSKLEDMLNGRRLLTYCVPVDQLLDRRLFIDSNTTGHYASIYVTSIEKTADGFAVQLHGKDQGITYTFVTDATSKLGWRLLQ